MLKANCVYNLISVMNPKVSIIVPVYKAEAYLHRCIDSILAQTFTDWELLLIDDGSPDRSGEICDEYAKKDKRIRVFHKENGGVSSARQRGVKEARGEWICFVDADDALPLNALCIMLSYAAKYDTDIVVGGLLNDKRMLALSPQLTIENYRKGLIEESIPASPWAKLFRRELFTPIVFDMPRSIVFGEDLLMNIRLAYNTSKPVVVCKEKVYEYEQNEESCMHTFKMTVGYAALYFSEKARSIPDFDKEEVIAWSLQHKFRFLEKCLKDLSFKTDQRFFESDFVRGIKSDISHLNYKCTFYYRFMLKHHVRIITMIAYYLKRISER